MVQQSDYSKYFRDLSATKAGTNKGQLERSRMEQFRLELDLNLLSENLKGPTILDFPIGTGRIFPNFIGTYDVFGYDISAAYVAKAREQHPELASHFHMCSLEDPVTDRTFDTIITLRTLRNIPEKAHVAKNIANLLRPGGRWIFNYLPPAGEERAFEQLLQASGLRVLLTRRYDYHASLSRMGRIEARLYRLYWRLVERGLVPHGGMNVVERALGHRGAKLYVCERSRGG